MVINHAPLVEIIESTITLRPPSVQCLKQRGSKQNTCFLLAAAAAHLSFSSAPCTVSFLIRPCLASPWWKLTLITGDTVAPPPATRGRTNSISVWSPHSALATEREADSWRAGPAAAFSETRGQRHKIYGLDPPTFNPHRTSSSQTLCQRTAIIIRL